MKRIISISLISLLLISSIGITVHQHSCDSKLISTTIFSQEDDPCNDEMPMKEGSCQNKGIQYIVDSPIDLIDTISVSTVPFDWLDGLVANNMKTLPERVSFSEFPAQCILPIPVPNIYTRDQAFLL